MRFWVKLGGQIFDYNIKYIIFLLVLCLVSMYYSGQCRVIIDPTMHPNQYPTHYPIMDEDESLEKWVYQTFYLKMSPQDGSFSVLLPYRSGI